MTGKTRFAVVLAALWMTGLSGTASAATYVLKVDGLACPFCSYGVEKQLQKLKGVERVATNIKQGMVTVSTRSAVTLSEAQVRSAVKRAGFTLRGFKQK